MFGVSIWQSLVKQIGQSEFMKILQKKTFVCITFVNSLFERCILSMLNFSRTQGWIPKFNKFKYFCNQCMFNSVIRFL